MCASSLLKEAFLLSYGLTTPLMPLAAIAHWRASSAKDLLSLAQKSGEKAYVLSDYFYRMCSLFDHTDFFDKEIDFAQKENADWILIPSVNKETVNRIADYLHRPVVVLPFADMVSFEVEGLLEDDLRVALGGKKFRKLMRLVRKHEDQLKLELFRLSDIAGDERLIREISDVLNENILKYNHPVNPYSFDVLRFLSRTALAGDYVVKTSKHAEVNGDRLIHVSLSFNDVPNKMLVHLVHGQISSEVPDGLNLYLSDYYQLYKFADDLGYKSHNLGRGAVEEKKKVGGNKIENLYNILVPNNTKFASEVAQFGVYKSGEIW